LHGTQVTGTAQTVPVASSASVPWDVALRHEPVPYIGLHAHTHTREDWPCDLLLLLSRNVRTHVLVDYRSATPWLSVNFLVNPVWSFICG